MIFFGVVVVWDVVSLFDANLDSFGVWVWVAMFLFWGIQAGWSMWRVLKLSFGFAGNGLEQVTHLRRREAHQKCSLRSRILLRIKQRKDAKRLLKKCPCLPVGRFTGMTILFLTVGMIGFVIYQVVKQTTYSHELAKQIACGLGILKNPNNGLYSICFYQYPARQFLLPALPSFLFGRNWWSLNLGGPLYFFLSWPVFVDGVVSWFSNKNFESSSSSMRHNSIREASAKLDLVHDSMPAGEAGSNTMCLHSLFHEGIFWVALTALLFLNNFHFYSWMSVFEQGFFPVNYSLMLVGLWLLYNSPSPPLSMRGRKTWYLGLAGLLLLQVIHGYTTGLALVVLAWGVLLFGYKLQVTSNKLQKQKGESNLWLIRTILVGTFISLFLSLSYRQDLNFAVASSKNEVGESAGIELVKGFGSLVLPVLNWPVFSLAGGLVYVGLLGSLFLSNIPPLKSKRACLPDRQRQGGVLVGLWIIGVIVAGIVFRGIVGQTLEFRMHRLLMTIPVLAGTVLVTRLPRLARSHARNDFFSVIPVKARIQFKPDPGSLGFNLAIILIVTLSINTVRIYQKYDKNLTAYDELKILEELNKPESGVLTEDKFMFYYPKEMELNFKYTLDASFEYFFPNAQVALVNPKCELEPGFEKYVFLTISDLCPDTLEKAKKVGVVGFEYKQAGVLYEL